MLNLFLYHRKLKTLSKLLFGRTKIPSPFPGSKLQTRLDTLCLVTKQSKNKKYFFFFPQAIFHAQTTF